MIRPLVLAAVLALELAVLPCVGVSAPAHSYVWETTATSPAGKLTPIVTNAIPDQEQSLAAGSFTIDLSEVFRDTEGNALSYTAVSNRNGIATTQIEGNILTVNMHALGECRIRATARDDRNGKADDTFTLVIRSNQPPQLISESALQNYVLFSDGDPLTLNLSEIFQDPDGDNLTFNASSEASSIAAVTIQDGLLSVIPNNIGETRISVSANDLNGGFLQESFNIEVLRSYPALVSSEIELPFGDHRDQGNYRLVALPGATRVLLENIIDGKPNRDWTAYAPDTSNGNQLLPFDGSPAFTLGPGNGLWLLSKEDWIVNDRLVPTVSLNERGHFDVPLQPGWNIISNPFDLDIPWEAVSTLNDISQGIWRWERGYHRVDTLHSAANIPEAYYFNNIESRETLSLPYFFRDTVTSPPSKNSYSQSANSPVQAELSVLAPASEASAVVTLTWTDASTEGLDQYDQLAPPAHFSSLALALTPGHPDFERQPLALESRPLTNQVHQFELLLTAGATPHVSFSLLGLDQHFAERAILVNQLDTKTYDLLSQPAHQVVLEAPTVPFTLLIGGDAGVNEKLSTLTPSIHSLKQNYPNPFNPITTIEYALPTDQHVDLSIFDLMGRHIVTLQRGEMRAGLHRVQWTGNDKYANRVANGVYFYRLDAGTWSATRKMTLIR